MKKILLLLMLLLPMVSMAQRGRNDNNQSRYLAGAVPMVNGYVQFDKTYYIKGKDKATLMAELRDYVQKELVYGEDQLVLQVEDGKFSATMRRLHYRYDPEITAGEFDEDRRAEQWITDDAALTKNGTKLQRVSGKFRVFTIDRKNEVFRGLAKAAGAVVKKKVTKTVEVEEEEE